MASLVIALIYSGEGFSSTARTALVISEERFGDSDIQREVRVFGWTQQHLAASSDMDKITISTIELGKVSARLETLEKIAEALGIDTHHLFVSSKG